MSIFNFRKNKEEKITAPCCCGSQCEISEIENAKYIVLGACCKRSTDTFENVQQALKELEIEEQAINIGDMQEIAKYGVIQTPAFVINSKVVSYGKLIKVDEAKQLIERYMF